VWGGEEARWRGTGGRRLGEKGGERCTGGGRRGGRKRDYKGRRKREKKAKNYATLCNISQIKKMQRGGSQQIQGGELGLKGTGSGGLNPLVPPAPAARGKKVG